MAVGVGVLLEFLGPGEMVSGVGLGYPGVV